MERQPHILLAEDDADTRELVELILRHAGFRVSVTGDSSEVLDLLATDRFDALLLDNWMPEVTGLELCRTVRSLTKILRFSSAQAQSPNRTKRSDFPRALKAILPSRSTLTI